MTKDVTCPYCDRQQGSYFDDTRFPRLHFCLKCHSPLSYQESQPVEAAVLESLEARRIAGLHKYGKELRYDTPIDALLELGNEVYDLPRYYELLKYRILKVRELLQWWQAQGYELPPEVMQLLSFSTPSEEIEANARK